MRLLLASNDLRSRHLFDELAKHVDVAGTVNFDHIAPGTRLAAGLLSWRPARADWYRAFQMHPRLQRGRSRVLQQQLGLYHFVDAMLMWSSYCRPPKGIPAFYYFDESWAPQHGLPWSPWRQASFRDQAETYRDAKALFCMSEWARDQIIAWHRDCAGKTHVVGWGPCGIDLPAEEIPESARRPLVLHVSSDPERKGVDYLIDTAKIVRHHMPDAQFVVIGDMKSFDVGRAEGHVLFIGPIADKEVLAHRFRQASVFFLPHRYGRSPHVAVEAMSAGLPIIASHQGGVIELVDGQDIGFLVGVGDVGGYALAIEALLRNPERRASMGARARDLMRREYTWPVVAGKIVAVINQTMEKRNA